jgi:hypothetical protein
MHRTYLAGIERALRNPSLENLLKLANALDLTLTELFSSEQTERGARLSTTPGRCAPEREFHTPGTGRIWQSSWESRWMNTTGCSACKTACLISRVFPTRNIYGVSPLLFRLPCLATRDPGLFFRVSEEAYSFSLTMLCPSFEISRSIAAASVPGVRRAVFLKGLSPSIPANNSCIVSPSTSATRMIVVNRKSFRRVSRCPTKVRCSLQ